MKIFEFRKRSNEDILMKIYSNYIQSLEDYRDKKISGNALLDIWERSPEEIHYVYYNLFHLVCDEDIRKRDLQYKDFQLNQLDNLIDAMKKGEDISQLKRWNFL